MKRTIFFLIAFCIQHTITAQTLRVANARCNYRVNPLGVDDKHPSLSWEIQSDLKNIRQAAYRILVADDSLQLTKNNGNIWDSKKVNAAANVCISYAGKPLISAKKYYWKIMIWDTKGRPSVFSDISYWQMGLLQSSDWMQAKWIAYEVLPDSNTYIPLQHGNGKKAWGKRPDILPLFRKEFEIKKEIKNVTAFVCGLGQFEMNVNGKKIADHFLDPGWTQYSKHAQYVTFDITDQVTKGKNAAGFIVGNGFYYIPGARYRKMTGAYGYPKLIARIVIQYKDGSSENIITNESWKTAPSPVLFSSIYGGEDYDANREQPGWDKINFDDTDWKAVIETSGPPLLQSQIAEPVKVMESFEPITRKQLADSSWIFDLGQNFSGIPAIEVQGNKGDTVEIIPAELVNEDGSANQKGSGGPHCYTYILKGNGIETWQPRFSYYGFRYLQVKGAVPEKETVSKSTTLIKGINGLHIRNAAPETGVFTNSNPLFNKTNELIKWAIKSNTVSLFTDCPHREKLGWLEQTHLMGSSVQYNYDVAALNRKIIVDMMQAQYPDGKIPEIAPEFTVFTAPFDESPEWGSAAVILPWYHYLWYGDKSTLRSAYNMMKRYVGYLKNKSTGNILSHGLGDWFDIGPNRPGVAQLTPPGVTATAMYYYDITILEKAATVLNIRKDIQLYQTLGKSVKASFNEKFFDIHTKQYATGSQTANAMALYCDLTEERFRKEVLDNLVADIQHRGNALTAGDIGYRYVLKALEDAGRSDVIFAMNNRSDVPGYGYQLAQGATALTESWQAYPNVSNNHFMLGHLMEWFYAGLCGIKQAAGSVAFSDIEICPQPVGDIKEARADYRSINGLISVAWKRSNEQFELKVVIPPNTKAIVHFPNEYKKAPVNIGSGAYTFTVNKL
ncbi:MAG: family 78 glycoside hydrolase catalytic domain [Niabella sp.]